MTRKKYIDKENFTNLINALETNEDASVFVEYENGNDIEFVFRKTRFIGEEIILYGMPSDYTIGIIQDTYAGSKKEMLDLIWTEDMSDYDNHRIYIKQN